MKHFKRGPRPNPEALRQGRYTVAPDIHNFLQTLCPKRRREFIDEAMRLGILIYQEQKTLPL